MREKPLFEKLDTFFEFLVNAFIALAVLGVLSLPVWLFLVIHTFKVAPATVVRHSTFTRGNYEYCNVYLDSTDEPFQINCDFVESYPEGATVEASFNYWGRVQSIAR